MKAKRVGKNDVNTKTTQWCVIEEETEVLSVKPNLLDVLKPSKLLLQQSYSELYLV